MHTFACTRPLHGFFGSKQRDIYSLLQMKPVSFHKLSDIDKKMNRVASGRAASGRIKWKRQNDIRYDILIDQDITWVSHVPAKCSWLS